jgi:serine protease
MKSRAYQLFVFTLIALITTGMLFSSSSHATAAGKAAEPNAPQTSEVQFNPDFYEDDLINIIFEDGYKIRLREGQFVDLENRSLTSERAQEAFAAVAGGEFSRSFQTSEAELDLLRAQAKQLSGQQMPDLNLSFRIKLPEGITVPKAIEMFSQLDEVAGIFPIAKPLPPPAPPDYEDPVDGNFDESLNRNVYQRYLDAAPDGLDIRYAWEGLGGKGAGIKICDVEYGWNQSHADLPTIKLLGDLPDPTNPSSWWEHGTAVLGQLGAKDNGWGITGMVPDADFHFAAADTVAGGYNVASAINLCASELSAGDVILIEQQTAGPNAGSGQTGLVPTEWNVNVYNSIKLATGIGIIVVEAGGNGSENLDDSDYSPSSGIGSHQPFKTSNDSGAFIVGSANSPYTSSPHSSRTSSNYGSTVDLHGWGHDIVTSGYGAYYNDEGKNLWYTNNFGGTSGASPMITAAAAIVQANYKLKNGSYATPTQVKSILQDTGTPKVGTQNIGPQPDLMAAINDIWGFNTPNSPTINPASGAYNMPLQVTIGYGAGQNSSNTNIRYTLNGSETTPDSFIFIPEFGDTIYLNYGAVVTAKAFQYNAAAGRSLASQSVSAVYSSTTPKVTTPTITPGGGTYYQGQQFVLSTSTPGATIRYRTDGRSISFFYPGTEYTGPITLDPGTNEITARAYKDGYYKSDLASSGEIIINPITLPSPTIYPAGGTFSGEVTVYIGSTVLGAQIRYTTDGSTPTSSSPLFDEPFVLTESATVKARIYLEGYTESAVTSHDFTVVQQATTPTISPVSGTTANDNLQVTITNNSPGATVRYTTNGATPTSYSTVYAGPFNLGVGQHTVKAKAFLGGADPSDVSTATYTVYNTAVTISPPDIDPPGGNFNGPLVVTMTTETDADFIFYTLDASDPETSPTVKSYSGPFTLVGDETYYVRARAYKSGVGNSDMAYATIVVVTPTLGTVSTPTMTPPGGQYTNTVSVQINVPDQNPPFKVRRLFYTTDGTNPRTDFSQAGAGIPKNLTISNPTTLKAIAGQTGYFDSAIATEEYTFICATPEIDPASGFFTDSVSVTLSTGTLNSTLYYTTDGSEPTDSDMEYTAPFTLTTGIYTVKAKCYRNNFEESETAVGVLVVNPSPVAPVILTHPVDQTVDAGQIVTFSVQAAGIPDPEYVWTKDGIPIAGETEADLLLPAAALSNAGEYQVIVSNSAGEALSQIGTLVVNPIDVNLSIKKEAHAPMVYAGERITYTLTMSNSEDVPVLAQIVDTLAPSAAVSSISDDQDGCGSLVGGVVTCTFSLAASTESQVHIYVETNSTYSGTLSNTAVITSTEGFINQNPDNSSGPVIVQIMPPKTKEYPYKLYLPMIVREAKSE